MMEYLYGGLAAPLRTVLSTDSHDPYEPNYASSASMLQNIGIDPLSFRESSKSPHVTPEFSDHSEYKAADKAQNSPIQTSHHFALCKRSQRPQEVGFICSDKLDQSDRLWRIDSLHARNKVWVAIAPARGLIGCSGPKAKDSFLVLVQRSA